MSSLVGEKMQTFELFGDGSVRGLTLTASADQNAIGASIFNDSFRFATVAAIDTQQPVPETEWFSVNHNSATDAVTAIDPSQTISITAGADVEIDGGAQQSVDFTSTTGTLKIDNSIEFTGQVSGLSGSDTLDLADISYGPNTSVTLLGNMTGGTLTVSDGTRVANIALRGDYLSSSWTLSSDGSGGTNVVDPVATNNWQPINIGAGGYLTGMDIAPDDTMVVRTDTYGAYLWNGAQWQQLVTASSMPTGFVAPGNNQGVYEIQIAPSNSNIMYMMYEGDVLKSTNKGATWTETSFAQVAANPNDFYRMDGQKMAVDPDNPNIVYVGTPQNGLFVTTDGGSTWNSVSAVPGSLPDSHGGYQGITGIEFDPENPNIVFAASNGNGVYETTNGGATWSKLNGGPSNVEYAAISSTGVYYAVGDNYSDVWSYANGAWTKVLANVGYGPIHTIAVDPFNPNEIVAAGIYGNLDESHDGGRTWSGWDNSTSLASPTTPWITKAISPYLLPDAMVFDQLTPNKLLTSAAGDFWTATIPDNVLPGSPITWNSLGSGVEQLVANEVLVPPGGNPILASWDRAFFYVSNPDTSPSTYGPVAGSTIVGGWSLDYASSNPSFIVGIADGEGGPEESGYSTNGGQTWTFFPTNPPGAGIGTDVGGTIAASTPSNIIWAAAGGHQPYYTLDGGETWNPVVLPGVSNWSVFDTSYALDTRTVTADRVLPNTFYMYFPTNGTASGFYKSTDGGASWTQMSHVFFVGSGFNSELESVPGEAGNLFWASGPVGGTTAQHPFHSDYFYQSTNGGATWTAVPNVLEVQAFGFGAPAAQGGYPSIYIVGWVNDVYGIWQSNDDAHSWIQIGVWPENSLDDIKTISGDPNHYGQVYIGFNGSGYAYLQAASPPPASGEPAPTITGFSPETGANANITNSSVITLSGNAQASDIVTIYDGTKSIGTTIAGANGTWTYVTNTLVNGTHSFTATAADSAGDISPASPALDVTVDTTPPAGVFGSVSFAASNGAAVLSGTWSDTMGPATVQVFAGATLLGAATVNTATGTWSLQAMLTAGTYNQLHATITDGAGNTVTIATPEKAVVTDITLGNGSTMVEGEAWNADGTIHDISYSDIIGQAYSSYDVIYSANRPTNATYSNGMTETWAYNANGSVQSIVYNNIIGQNFTSTDTIFGTNGKPASEIWTSGTKTVQSETWNSDGSIHDIHLYAITNQAYTSYDVVYSNNKPVSAIYSNGMTQTWSYNTDGSYETHLNGLQGGTSSTNIYDTTNHLAAQAVINTNGSEALRGMENGLTITSGPNGSTFALPSPQNDNFAFSFNSATTITGGGNHESFAFQAGFGNVAITDFVAHSQANTNNDTIAFAHGLFQSFADLQAQMSQDKAGNTIIHDSHGDTLTLAHTTITSLHANDFILA